MVIDIGQVVACNPAAAIDSYSPPELADDASLVDAIHEGHKNKRVSSSAGEH